MTSRWHTNKEHSIFAMFIRRTRTLWCLELIPAELEALAKLFMTSKRTTAEFSLRHTAEFSLRQAFAELFMTCSFRLKNKECIISCINTCWTWGYFVKCLWRMSSRVTNYFSGNPCSFEEIKLYDILNEYLLVFFRKGSVRNQPRFKKWHLRMKQ